jgi:hypothetical protein
VEDTGEDRFQHKIEQSYIELYKPVLNIRKSFCSEEELKEYYNKYYEINKEKMNVYSKEYYQKNKERHMERQRERRAEKKAEKERAETAENTFSPEEREVLREKVRKFRERMKLSE